MPEQLADYAVVIGLNDYPKFGSQGRPLEGAIEDAKRFATWVSDSETGGGVPAANCELILSTPDPLTPSKFAIDEALAKVKTAGEAAGDARRLYFYFSGHGQAKGPQDVALCLCHWSAVFRNAALSATLYRDMFLRCMPFREIVILLDCCRIRTIDATGLESEIACALPVAGSGEKRFLLAYATEFQNAAMEAAADDGEGPIVRGHFTEALLAGLRGGAAQPGGGVPSSGLKRYLELNVTRVAAEHQHVQNAVVETNFKESEQPVFGSAKPAGGFRIEFSPGRTGEIVLEGPTLDEIKRGDASTGPWALELDRGLYLLRDLTTGEERPIPFRGSEEVTVVVF